MKCKKCGNPRTRKVRKTVPNSNPSQKGIVFVYAVCPKGHKCDMEE